jgi:hypothetical protein
MNDILFIPYPKVLYCKMPLTVIYCEDAAVLKLCENMTLQLTLHALCNQMETLFRSPGM